MVQACDDRQVKSLLLRSCLMFLLVDKKTVTGEQENKQISQLFIFMLYFQSIVFHHVLCQRAERVQRPKLLLILERDNSERALWCQTVCFIKSTAWPHALNPLQCKLASLRKNTRQLLKFNVVSQYCTVTVLYCQLCLNLYIHAA